MLQSDIVHLDIKSEGLVTTVSMWLAQVTDGKPAARAEELLPTLWNFDLRLTLGNPLWMGLITWLPHWAWEGAQVCPARSELERHGI